MNKKLVIALVAPLALFAIACATPTKSTSQGGTKVDNASPVPVVSSAAPTKASGPFVAFKDGQYEVGTGAGQVKPGTYKTTVPADSFGCYWERQKNLEGGFDSIIANDNAKPGAPVIVTIKASDKGFKTQGCGEWKAA